MKTIAKVCCGAVLFVVCAFVLRDLFIQQWPTRSTLYANEEYQALTLKILKSEIDELKATNAVYLVRLDNLADYRVRTVKALQHYTYESNCASLKSAAELIVVFKELMSMLPASPLKDALWKLGEALDQFVTRQRLITIEMGDIMSGKEVD